MPKTSTLGMSCRSLICHEWYGSRPQLVCLMTRSFCSVDHIHGGTRLPVPWPQQGSQQLSKGHEEADGWLPEEEERGAASFPSGDAFIHWEEIIFTVNSYFFSKPFQKSLRHGDKGPVLNLMIGTHVKKSFLLWASSHNVWEQLLACWDRDAHLFRFLMLCVWTACCWNRCTSASSCSNISALIEPV